jgi:hypothetical protein
VTLAPVEALKYATRASMSAFDSATVNAPFDGPLKPSQQDWIDRTFVVGINGSAEIFDWDSFRTLCVRLPMVDATESWVRPSALVKVPAFCPDDVRGSEIAEPETVTDCGSANDTATFLSLE